MREAQDKALSAIGEAASEWAVLLDGAGATSADKAAFMDWLRQSPLHVQEYLRAEVAFLALQEATSGDSTDIRALLGNAPRNVIELAASTRPELGQAVSAAGAVPDAPRVVASRRIRFFAAAATMVLALGIVFGPRLIDRLRSETYATATGEQHRVVLADGSTIDLNTQTRLRVAFTDTARDIQLNGGEAYFNVAKDSMRPFTVTAGSRQVRALGTSFMVRDDGRQLSITLIEGKVTVGSALSTAQGESLTLVPGQRVTFASAGKTPRLDSPAIDKVTAWRERRLVFEDRTIAEVAAEFNRYNARQIVIADPGLANERINGVFDADKPGNLTDFLVRNTGARIEEHPGRLTVTRARGAQ